MTNHVIQPTPSLPTHPRCIIFCSPRLTWPCRTVELLSSSWRFWSSTIDQTAISASRTFFCTAARLLHASTASIRDWDKPEAANIEVSGRVLQASSSTVFTVNRLLGRYRRIGLPPVYIVSCGSDIALWNYVTTCRDAVGRTPDYIFLGKGPVAVSELAYLTEGAVLIHRITSVIQLHTWSMFST